MPDHYFSAHPAHPDERRTLEVFLAGRTRTVVTAPGIFSPGGLDKGTTILLEHAPTPPEQGHFLDLGCGWGPLALTLALRSPRATVTGIDVNERAVDLLRVNAERLDLTGVRASAPEGVPPDRRFDVIWSNPPIRVGKAVLHEMLRTWLPRLADGGTAYLVVQKHLGSDSLQRWMNTELDGLEATRHASSKGFRVLRVARAG